MSTDQDPQLAARFAAFRASTEPALRAHHGADARMLAGRHRRRSAMAAAALAVIALAGGVALVARPADRPERLIPATASESTVEGIYGGATVEHATIDLTRVQAETCDVSSLTYDHVEEPPADPSHGVIGFGIGAPPGKDIDVDRDGRDDWFAEISCDGDPRGAHQIVVLSGEPPELTAIAVLPDAVTDPMSFDFSVDQGTGLLSVRVDTWKRQSTQYEFRWQNDRLTQVSRQVLPPSSPREK